MPTWLATKVRGMTSEVSPLSAQRAQFTFSALEVYHAQQAHCAANYGANHYGMRARHELLETKPPTIHFEK